MDTSDPKARLLRAAYDVRVGSSVKAVLVALAFRSMLDGGDTEATTGELCDLTRLARRTVLHALRRLEQARHITRFRSPGRAVITRVHPRAAG